jgi:hypothetical protein
MYNTRALLRSEVLCFSLCDAACKEAVSLYGCEPLRRPSKRSANVHSLKEQVDVFLQNNVTFVDEVPSACAKPCMHDKSDYPSCQHHHTHIRPAARTSGHQTSSLVDTVANLKKCIEKAHHLNRTRATEVLLFMLSDLDRHYKPEIPHAYGLQGHILRADTMINMLDCILDACSKHGLYLPVFSSDGQWYNLCVKDALSQPLTILQLQKQTWVDIKKMQKGEIVRQLASLNVTASKPEGEEHSGIFGITIDTNETGQLIRLEARPVS